MMISKNPKKYLNIFLILLEESISNGSFIHARLRVVKSILNYIWAFLKILFLVNEHINVCLTLVLRFASYKVEAYDIR